MTDVMRPSQTKGIVQDISMPIPNCTEGRDAR